MRKSETAVIQTIVIRSRPCTRLSSVLSSLRTVAQNRPEQQFGRKSEKLEWQIEQLGALVKNPSLPDAESRFSLQVEREDRQSGPTSNYESPPSAVNRRS